jgi:hypothetical protein
LEKAIIIYEANVIDYFNKLIFELYEKDYFSYLEYALDYVNHIYDFIDNKISIAAHKRTPTKLTYLGEFYTFYKSNAQTTWFVFFDKRDNEFLIRGILNNHCKEVSYLNF